MRKDLVKNLEYIVICAERAILQEKGQMEKLGKWYIRQELDEIYRSVEKARIIHNGRQHTMRFKKS